ncbi:MAG: ATP-binding response regulator, partial [Pyrinomonadaceae bacterium]
SGGQVTVGISRTNGHVEIKVKDTGVGLTSEFLPHVFDRFRQADASSIRKFGGLGLGLAIVRHITEMHGGSVAVESAGENQGSTFTVNLPVVAMSEDEEGIDLNESGKTALYESEMKLSLDGLLILVVDDEEDTRQLLVQSLTHYGATVIAAKSAAEGLQELIEKSPDVIVSDIGMPDEHGYSFIKKVRALEDENHKNITAVALTAYTRAQDRMRASSSGFHNHVAKPFEPDELATVIASLKGKL